MIVGIKVCLFYEGTLSVLTQGVPQVPTENRQSISISTKDFHVLPQSVQTNAFHEPSLIDQSTNMGIFNDAFNGSD
jgi:hypothetical protein